MGNTAVLAIRIISDASKAAQGMDQTATKASKMSRAGSAAGKILAVGLGAAAFAAVKATKAAADDAAAQARLHGIMRQAAGATAPQIKATEKWITAQGKAKGVADDELRPALGRLISVTHDVGKSQRLASLAMDISAGTGKSLETVSTALAKAQAGSTGGLSRLGVATKTASGQTKSLTAITKDLAKTYGGAAAKQAQTAAGKQKILSVQMGELQEKIGAKLIPVMTKLAEVGLTVVNWISRHTNTTLALIGALGALLAIVKLVSIATQIYSAGAKIVMVVQKAWTATQWLLNVAMEANPIGLVVVAIVALVAVIVLAWKHSETFRKIVIAAWNAIKSATKAVWNWIKGAISAVWKFLVTYVKTEVKIIKAVISAVWNAIKKATSAVWNGIKKVVSSVVGFVVGFVKSRLTQAKAIITAVWNGIKSLTSRAWNAWKSIIQNVVGKAISIVLGIKSRVLGFFRNAGTWLLDTGRKIIGGLIDGIRAMFGKVRDALGNLTSKLTSWKGPPSKDRKLLSRSGELIIEGFVSGIKRRHDMVRRAMSDVTKIVAGSAPSSAGALALGGSGTAGLASSAGRVYVIHEHVTINGATDPLRTAKALDDARKQRERRLGIRS